MSIRVELHELREVAAQQAPFAYLLTVSDDATAHAVAITPAIGDVTITCEAGNRSRANATARPNVSLLWPPARPDDYSLIVDGHAVRRRLDGGHHPGPGRAPPPRTRRRFRLRAGRPRNLTAPRRRAADNRGAGDGIAAHRLAPRRPPRVSR